MLYFCTVKKFLLAVLLLSVATLLPAQMIERQGNRYTVDGITYNTSASFRNNYLKFNNPELFNQYNKGYKLAAGGWGLLSAGVALTTVSAVMMSPNGEVSQLFLVWTIGVSVGALATCASIPMLGVGYHRMHQAVDSYNAKQKPLSYWSFEIHTNGVGFAYHF